MATTSRLLTLLSLLQARRDWPGSELASRLDVSDRTVRRDIDRLRDMGYRIGSTMGPDGGYRLEAGNDMPPLLFDDDQALAVAIALWAARRWGRASARPRCARSRPCDRCRRRGFDIGSTRSRSRRWGVRARRPRPRYRSTFC